jgi:hypothetical protein
MRFAFTCLALLAATSVVFGQGPRLAVVQPAGAKAGSTATVVISGQDLDGVESLHFSFPGVKVEALGAEKIVAEPTPKKGAAKMAATPTNAPKFRVMLPVDAPLGIHDVRAVGKHGVSNPRAFVVGDLTEEVEKEPNDDVGLATKIPLNATVNGVIDKGIDVDYFQFPGKKGQKIVVSCLSTTIDSKLPAVVELFHASGKLLASNRGYQNNDAVADAILPEDGEFFIRLSSFTYTQGGPDYSYRLTVGTMPWIDAVIPAAVEPGKETKVEVWGRNLPGGVLDSQQAIDGRSLERVALTVKPPSEPQARQRLAFSGLALPAMSMQDGFEVRLKNPSGSSNPAFVALAKGAVATEREPNDQADKGQPIALPALVSGRIDRAGDADWYRVALKRGVPNSVQLFADRLNPSPLGSGIDLKFIILGPKGNVITTVDDDPEILANPFHARSDDPARFRFVPAEDGEYSIGVSAADGGFGARHVYVLRVAEEDGDFRVIAMPASVQSPDAASTGPAGNYAFNVYIWRLGNFTGDVTIQGKTLPPGVSVKPQVISGNQKQAAMVVSIADDAPAFTGPIELEAVGVIGGQKVVRDVRAATITYPVPQAGVPLLARLDRELILAIREPAKYAIVPTRETISILQGEKLSIPVKLKVLGKEFKQAVQATGVALPVGLNLQPTTLKADGETVLSFDSKATLLPGTYTIALRGQTQIPKDGKQPAKGAPPNAVEYAPPIQLTVVPKQMLKITPPNEAIKLIRGQDAEAVFTVAPLFPFAGAVEATLQSGPNGIGIDPVKFEAKETAVRMRVRAAADTPQGNSTVTLRFSARFNDLSIPHDVKTTVNVK